MQRLATGAVLRAEATVASVNYTDIEGQQLHLSVFRPRCKEGRATTCGIGMDIEQQICQHTSAAGYRRNAHSRGTSPNREAE